MTRGNARHFLSAFLASVLSTLAFAMPLEAPKAVKEALQKQLPDLIIDSIRPSAVDHLYQVVSGPSVLYVSENGQYIIQGDVFDLKNEQKNITELDRRKALLTSINQLEKKGYVVIWYKAPKEKQVLTVFTDLDCSYCRRFHQEIPALNARGVSVRYLAFPREGPNSPTYQKTEAVWCAKNNAESLTQAKKGSDIDLSVRCEQDSVKAQYDLGILAGVRGTPTMVLPDGAIVPGYMKADRLLVLLGIK